VLLFVLLEELLTSFGWVLWVLTPYKVSVTYKHVI
jgi:hypothetical protein